MTLSDSQVKERFNSALSSFMSDHQSRLGRLVGERNITSHLSRYLLETFAPYDVDHEYDRLGTDRKKIQSAPFKKELSLVTPDIIVHGAGDPLGNLLVIQTKLSARVTPRSRRLDLHYLRRFTDLDGRFEYRLGLFLVLDPVADPIQIWYAAGKRKSIQ